jgi:hypothetical protein
MSFEGAFDEVLSEENRRVRTEQSDIDSDAKSILFWCDSAKCGNNATISKCTSSLPWLLL